MNENMIKIVREDGSIECRIPTVKEAKKIGKGAIELAEKHERES